MTYAYIDRQGTLTVSFSDIDMPQPCSDFVVAEPITFGGRIVAIVCRRCGRGQLDHIREKNSMTLKVQGIFSNGLVDVRDTADPGWTGLFTKEEWDIINVGNYDRGRANSVKHAQPEGWEAEQRNKEADLVRESQNNATTSPGDESNAHDGNE